MHELTLSQAEARRLTDEVKADAKQLWAKLRRLYQGGAHIALGYTSWSAYCEHEFHMRKTHAYRLLQAAQVVNQLALEFLRTKPDGATATEIHDYFQRNIQGSEIHSALRQLVEEAPRVVEMINRPRSDGQPGKPAGVYRVI
jgi:hypothetical protein